MIDSTKALHMILSMGLMGFVVGFIFGISWEKLKGTAERLAEKEKKA